MQGPTKAGWRLKARRADTWLAAAAVVSGLFLFAALFYPLLRGNLYQGSDLGAFHLPARSFYSQCLNEGLRFLWWPAQFCGYYLHGEGQAGMFHPFHWVIYRFLPLDWAFNVEFASAYVFLHAGVVALLRHWRLPWFAVLFGANLFTFSGFTLIHFVHMQAIAVIAHLPWLLLAVDVLLKAENYRVARRAWVCIALLSASQLLLGYPQYVLIGLLAIGLYALAHWRVPHFPRRIAALALSLTIGLMIAGVQVAPTFDMLSHALRHDSEEWWRSGSLHPLNLLQWAGPYWFENRLAYGVPALEYGLYTGMTPLLLALWLLARMREQEAGWPPVGIFFLQAGLMLIFALGEYGGVYGLLAKLPVIGSFRCPARHIVLIHFSLAVLGALAVARLRSAEAMPRDRRGPLILAMAVFGAWMTLGLAWYIRASGPEAMRAAFTQNTRWMIAGPLLLTAAAITVLIARRWPVPGLLLLMAFSTADIAGYAIPQVWNHAPQSTPLAALRTVLEQEIPAGARVEGRVRDYRAHGNWRVARLAQVGLPNYMGYVGLPPAWVLDPDSETTKRIAGVRWEKQPLHAREWTPRENALPRARLVSLAVTSDDPRGLAGSVDVGTTAVVDRPLSLHAGPPGTVTWKRDEPGNVFFETHAEGTQLLIFAERYHSGWRASVDGKGVALERVYGDFMGCVVPAGAHNVGFYFAPASLRIGAFMTAVGLLLLAAGTWRWPRAYRP